MASATEKMARRLEREKAEHSQTRRLLQAEITRIWRLVPSHHVNLMGVYPPLRRLLHVLGEAADLQDPARGVPIGDTMRSQFVHVGANASTSHTEASVATHARARHNTKVIRDEMEGLVRYFTKLLDDKAHSMARLVGSEEWEYPEPPKCQRTECSHRNRKQPFSAWQTGCVGCGRSLAEKV